MAYPYPEPTPGEFIEEMAEQRRRNAHKHRVLMFTWNDRYPIGTAVTYRENNGRLTPTTTTSAASMFHNSVAVIELEGYEQPVALERVEALFG